MSKLDYDNCICSEWDGKGWSVCGVPCSVHITKDKVKEGIKETEEFLNANKASKDPVIKALRDNMKSRLQTLRAWDSKL